ncbi:MAG: hypothetical protein NC102_04120 [Clostridium sp.]|nr:hypothetical protein [Clostridium sp.]
MKYQFYADKTGGRKACLVFKQRIALLEHLGIAPIKIGDICHRLNYPQYVTDIIISADEKDLCDNYNESWHKMRQIAEKFSEARLRGRDCYHTAKDLCIDAMFTDLIYRTMKEEYPTFDFRKNGQDKEFELLTNVSLEPDFALGGGAMLEMKITKTATDDVNRSNWSGRTFTLRENDLQSQLWDYKQYRPLYFLRINYEDKVFAIINYNDFRASYQRDGSYFAYIQPKKIAGNLKEFVKAIHDELIRITKAKN